MRRYPTHGANPLQQYPPFVVRAFFRSHKALIRYYDAFDGPMRSGVFFQYPSQDFGELMLIANRLLWVDAVCINQNDFGEKGSQVSQMGNIYRQANRVLIHLGEAHEGSDQVMDLIADRKICDQQQRKDVVSFFGSRPWFHRVWVLQEVALADVALVVCGSKCVPWANFPAWWARNIAYFDEEPEVPPTLAYDPVMTKRTSLMQQLQNTRRSQSTDPRDTIYALLGLLSPSERSKVLPDYLRPASQVFAETTADIILRDKSLKILSGIESHVEDSQSLISFEVPSWVPDWTQTCGITSLGLSNDYMEPYDAGGTPACDVTIQRSVSSKPSLLCQGVRVDTIRWVGPVCPVKGLGEDLATTLTLWSRGFRDFQTQCTSFRLRAEESRLESTIKHSRGQFYVSTSNPPEVLSTIFAEPASTLEMYNQQQTDRRTGWVPPERLRFCLGRRMFITSQGLLGLGPAKTQIGDLVTVLLGAPVPMILRTHCDETLTLVGECYVRGMMGGEGIAHLNIPGHRCRPYAEKRFSAPLQEFRLM
jgi:hypothetical protein